VAPRRRSVGERGIAPPWAATPFPAPLWKRPKRSRPPKRKTRPQFVGLTNAGPTQSYRFVDLGRQNQSRQSRPTWLGTRRRLTSASHGCDLAECRRDSGLALLPDGNLSGERVAVSRNPGPPFSAPKPTGRLSARSPRGAGTNCANRFGRRLLQFVRPPQPSGSQAEDQCALLVCTPRLALREFRSIEKDPFPLRTSVLKQHSPGVNHLAPSLA